MPKIIFAAAALIAVLSICVASQTSGAMFEQDVTWSPDGKSLTFTGMHDFDDKAHKFKADIYVIQADGSDLKMIGSETKNEFYTSWAKGRIAFSCEVPGTKDSDIYTVNPDGSGLRQLTKASKRNSTPSISKDGKRIAFISTRDGGKYQIYTMNADGSNVTRVTKDDGIAFFNPQWSPDGKRLVYYAEKGDQRDQIWVMNSDGSNNTLLTGNVGHNIFPGWSHDGKRIIFCSSRRDVATAGGTYVDDSYVYVMNADGSALQRIGNINSFFARFSPDGKRIAYISGKFPSTWVFIANADGSGATKITK